MSRLQYGIPGGVTIPSTGMVKKVTSIEVDVMEGRGGQVATAPQADEGEKSVDPPGTSPRLSSPAGVEPGEGAK